jgi:hypothetical protein
MKAPGGKQVVKHGLAAETAILFTAALCMGMSFAVTGCGDDDDPNDPPPAPAADTNAPPSVPTAGPESVTGTWRGTSGSTQVSTTLDLTHYAPPLGSMHWDFGGTLHWPAGDDRYLRGDWFSSERRVDLYVEGGDYWRLVLNQAGDSMAGTGYKYDPLYAQGTTEGKETYALHFAKE